MATLLSPLPGTFQVQKKRQHLRYVRVLGVLGAKSLIIRYNDASPSYSRVSLQSISSFSICLPNLHRTAFAFLIPFCQARRGCIYISNMVGTIAETTMDRERAPALKISATSG